MDKRNDDSINESTTELLNEYSNQGIHERFNISVSAS
jgi:hypothetical protein